MRRRLILAVALLATAALVGALAVWTLARDEDDYTITAHFTSSTGIYPGDPVTILGVPVGSIADITPGPDDVAITLHITSDVAVPGNADAAIIPQSLVAGRSVQLAPAYTAGPALTDGAEIPITRTVVPMEWDDVKKALLTTTEALSPRGPGDPGAANQLVTSATDALGGHADQVNNTITSVSQALSVISDGRDDTFGIIRNLAVFTTAMSQSSTQIDDLQRRLASTATVLGSNRTEVSEAMTALDTVLGEIQTFLTENATILGDNVRSATDVTGNLAAQRTNLEGILHQAPTQMSNFYNLYHPGLGDLVGSFSLSNFENPIATVCGAIAGAGATTSQRAGELCAQYIGPYLNTLKTSYPDVVLNPTRTNFADPGQQIPSVPGVLTTVPGLPGNDPAPVTVPDRLASLLLPKATS